MRYLFALPALMLALPALTAPTLSDVSCTFVQECFDGEACTPTEYSLTMQNTDDQTDSWELVSDAETLQGTGIGRDGPSHMIFTGNTALHLVSVGADKNARYTVHMEGPMAITYLGKCEALN